MDWDCKKKILLNQERGCTKIRDPLISWQISSLGICSNVEVAPSSKAAFSSHPSALDFVCSPSLPQGFSAFSLLIVESDNPLLWQIVLALQDV